MTKCESPIHTFLMYQRTEEAFFAKIKKESGMNFSIRLPICYTEACIRNWYTKQALSLLNGQKGKRKTGGCPGGTHTDKHDEIE